MGSGKGSSCYTTGYRYYAGLHLIFCHALDKLLKIRVGEKIAWQGTVSANQTLSINKPSLFGGEGREGGVKGSIDVCFGMSSQGRNSYLQSVLGTSIPAFRGLFGLIARKCMLSANNPYIKEWSILGQRTLVGWRDDLAEIVAPDGCADMNPAHIIYETLTNATWGGLGYPVADLDMASMLTAANLLHAEGFGLSLLWAKNTSVEDFLQIILNHIDGKLFFSHTTGLLTLKLIRNDYNIGALPILNESNIVELVEYSGPSATESINQVVLNYVDRDNNPCAITVQDPAGITRIGQVNGTTIDLVGITNAELAAKVAARELQQLCLPISSCVLEVNRTHWDLEPGDCFNFTWGPLGIADMVMRVEQVEIGVHTDSKLRITAVRDVYGLGTITLAAPANSLWTSPYSDPANAVRIRVEEITWWQFVREYAGDSSAVLAELDDTSTLLISYCGRPSSDSLNYELWTRNQGASDFVKRDSDSFPFTGTLSVAIVPEISTVVQLQEALDDDLVQVGTYAAIGDELVAITAVDATAGTITVDRGVLDTVPVSHAAGTVFWCHQGFFGLDKEPRAVGEVVEAKLLPSTSQGRIAIGDATTSTITLAGRMMRPYPPGNVQINGSRWPASIGAAAELTLTWAHRDRTAQTVSLIRQDVGNIGPEPGVSYTVRAYGPTDALIHTESGITGSSCTVIDGGLIEDPLWGQTVLAMPMDGADDSTTFIDLKEKSVLAYGNARISTSQSKSGGASAFFDGSGDYLQVASSADFDFGLGDFTIEGWFYPTAFGGDSVIVSRYVTWSPSVAFYLGLRAGTPNILIFRAGNSVPIYLNGNTPIMPGTWVHVAVTRSSGVTKMFVGGVVQSATHIGSVNIESSGSLRIGANNDITPAEFFSGYMDNLRITKGAARYVENLTPPTSGVSQFVFSGELSPSLRFELESVRAGITSLQKWNLSVTRA